MLTRFKEVAMYKYDAPENPNRIKKLVGKQFDKLTIVGFLGMVGENTLEPMWLCNCECGNTSERRSSYLRRKESREKSCGCTNKTVAVDITGEKYGKLTAIRNTGKKNTNGCYIWEFACDCGNHTEREIGNLRHKPDSAQCQECTFKQTGDRNRTHGTPKNDKVYKTWLKIKERCFNINDKSYSNYGAKGITMQEDWVDDFVKFRDYIGRPPDDGKKYSIDRIDNSKGYEEGNIRWATTHQQARNKTKHISNTSGKTGVNIEHKMWPDGINCTTYAVAQWKDINGKNCKKCFSFKKYGEELAFFAACEYREKQIMLLNLQGAGYTENHGK